MAAPTSVPASANGLALAEAYFYAVGEPMLEHRFPEIRTRVAAGLVGMGSECLGFDDRLSRDHDWGPGFCLWLKPKDYQCWGQRLQKAYDDLPDRFQGVSRRTSAWGRGRVGVHAIDRFYKTFTGLPGAPETSMQWLLIPEYNLAALAGGKVFTDPEGTFSSVRHKIKAYYPETVRLKKLAARAMSAAQAGQYNYRRCLQRADAYSTSHALMRFCKDALAMVFLLNWQYMPYFKWHCRAAARLPRLGPAIARHVAALCDGGDPARKIDRVDAVCTLLADELRRQGVSEASGNALLDHGPNIQRRIDDPELTGLSVWYGGN